MIVLDDTCHTGYRHEKIETNDIFEDTLISIDEDRYTGSYSGFRYTAWWGLPPDAIDAGDPTCSEFWDKYLDKLVCGKGNTPQEAFVDLCHKYSALGLATPIDEDVVSGIPKVIISSSYKLGMEVIVIGSDSFKKWLASSE